MNTGDKAFFNLPPSDTCELEPECVRIAAYPDAPIDLPLIDGGKSMRKSIAATTAIAVVLLIGAPAKHAEAMPAPSPNQLGLGPDL
jgi:hypothetical protein